MVETNNKQRAESALEMLDLQSLVDTWSKRIAISEHLQEEMKTMQLVWSTAHSTLTQDMRELMARFHEATPLQVIFFSTGQNVVAP